MKMYQENYVEEKINHYKELDRMAYLMGSYNAQIFKYPKDIANFFYNEEMDNIGKTQEEIDKEIDKQAELESLKFMQWAKQLENQGLKKQ